MGDGWNTLIGRLLFLWKVAEIEIINLAVKPHSGVYSENIICPT